MATSRGLGGPPVGSLVPSPRCVGGASTIRRHRLRTAACRGNGTSDPMGSIIPLACTSVPDSTVRSLESEAKGQLHPKSAETSVRVATLAGHLSSPCAQEGRPTFAPSTRARARPGRPGVSAHYARGQADPWSAVCVRALFPLLCRGRSIRFSRPRPPPASARPGPWARPLYRPRALPRRRAPHPGARASLLKRRLSEVKRTV